jgi:hypothetical protein
MTPAKEEAYVRERWKVIEVTNTYAGTHCAVEAWSVWLPCGWRSSVGSISADAQMWHDAYLFTVKREAEIADIQAEIAWLEWPSTKNNSIGDIRERIIAREQSALAELRRGMKEQG